MILTNEPSFVQYGFRLMPPAPYIHRGVAMYSFAVAGDPALVQRLCDRWFQTPSDGAVKYTVVTPYLFVTSLSVASVSSGDASLGTVPEIRRYLGTRLAD